MMYDEIALELIEFIQDETGCFVLVEGQAEETYVDDYVLEFDIEINEDIENYLPLDITEFLEGKATEYNVDIEDILDGLSVVVLDLNRLGITAKLGYITFNFEIIPEEDKYYLKGIII